MDYPNNIITMNLDDYKNLTQQERIQLDKNEKAVEETASLETLKNEFEAEIKKEVEEFKNDDVKIDQIIQSVNLSDPETVNNVETEIELDEKLKEMNNSAISIQWRFREEFEDMKRSLQNIISIPRKIADAAAYKINSFVDAKKIDSIKDKINLENEGSFDAKAELLRIKKLPLAEKEPALKSYREKLTLTYKGIASVQDQLVTLVKERPGITKEEFEIILKEKAKPFGLGPDIIKTGMDYFDKYETRHKDVEAFLKNKSGEDVFKELFRAIPKGVIEFEKDPVAVYLTCYSQEDYAWVYKNSDKKDYLIEFSKNGLKEVDVEDSDRWEANQSGGVKLNTSLKPELQGSLGVTNGDSLRYYNDPSARLNEIKTHEFQHIWFDAIFDQQSKSNDLWYEKWNKKGVVEIFMYMSLTLKSVDIMKRHFDEYVKAEVGFMAESARNEILAYLADGSEIERIYSILETPFFTTPAENGGLYDYLAPLRSMIDQIKSFTKEYEKNNISNTGDLLEESEYIKEKLDTMLFTAADATLKYNTTLKTALDSINTASNPTSEENKFSRQEIIALLTDVPLDQYSKVIKRALLKPFI